MVTINAFVHKDTAELVQYLNDQRPHLPRNFVPDLVEGTDFDPCTGWKNLTKPPENGWWANRQSCQCPPCYFFDLKSQINRGTLPFAVAVPLAQLINVGLIRLNFRHPGHNNVFTAEDKDYALSLHRDVCYGINSGKLPLQLLEILLLASRKAVLKPLDQSDPEYQHKEFEVYLKRAIRKCKDQGDEQEDEDVDDQAGAGAEDDNNHCSVACYPICESLVDDLVKETANLWTAPVADHSHS
ncbi:hypothetical protein E4T43_08661 [Aureobasidium subglaciale]|nr:hypothetical protein E4T43_08661 [Aureobasidium subglaciale]